MNTRSTSSRMVGLALLGNVFLGVTIIASCNDNEPVTCALDTDCPGGFLCREKVCSPVGGDASAPPDGATAPACGNEYASCVVNEDCCSRTCGAGGRCTATTAPAPTATCRGSFELCQNDCCAGLKCISGSCR